MSQARARDAAADETLKAEQELIAPVCSSCRAQIPVARAPPPDGSLARPAWGSEHWFRKRNRRVASTLCRVRSVDAVRSVCRGRLRLDNCLSLPCCPHERPASGTKSDDVVVLDGLLWRRVAILAHFVRKGSQVQSLRPREETMRSRARGRRGGDSSPFYLSHFGGKHGPQDPTDGSIEGPITLVSINGQVDARSDVSGSEARTAASAVSAWQVLRCQRSAADNRTFTTCLVRFMRRHKTARQWRSSGA